MALHLPRDDEVVAFIQTNIRKPNSESARRFARYKVARSLEEAKKLGATTGDLQNDLRRGVLHRGKKLRHWSILRTIQLFAPSDKARIAFAPNLKRPKSKAWERYQAYSKAQTLEEAKRLGIWPGDVANDLSQGLLGTNKTRWEAMRLKVCTVIAKKKKSSKGGRSAKAKATGAKGEKAQCKRACDKLASNDCLVNEKFMETEKKTMRSKELSRKRNAECRAGRAAAREAWVALGCSKVQPLKWSRKRGWADVAKKCAKKC